MLGKDPGREPAGHTKRFAASPRALPYPREYPTAPAVDVPTSESPSLKSCAVGWLTLSEPSLLAPLLISSCSHAASNDSKPVFLGARDAAARRIGELSGCGGRCGEGLGQAVEGPLGSSLADTQARGRAGVQVLRQRDEINPEVVGGFKSSEQVRDRTGKAVQSMNSKRKGNRNELRTMRLLEAAGYQCSRAAASLGTWDAIRISPADIVLVRVKTREWPGGIEMEEFGSSAAQVIAGTWSIAGAIASGFCRNPTWD